MTRLMNQAEKRVTHYREIVSRDLCRQEQRLEERIHKRRTMSNRSVNSDQDLENEEGINEKFYKRVGVQMEGKGLVLNPKRVFI